MFLYAIYALLAIALVASIPKPQSQPAPEAQNIEVPTAEEGRAIPVLFGTRHLKGPNVTWYGDFKTEEVKA